MMSLASLPLQLSKYKLLEEIGHGGMATVYRALDTRLEREVALKLIHRHLRQSSEVEARFNSEARAIAKLRHPNIVEVFDVSDDDEPESFLIMELVRGCTVRDLCAREGALPVELAAMIVLELAAALEHAHDVGVIHRDIKPENVLVELPTTGQRASVDDWDLPRIKLTDFGIAKLLDAQGITSTGQVLGSPAHMAPEQIEGKPVDVRADVFSLAVLFYELVVGATPFEGNNPAQVLRNVLDVRYRAPEMAKPEIGERWGRVIARALEREPDDRFLTVGAFAEAIKGELAEVGFSEPRKVITSFLLSPTDYKESFSDTIVEGLVRSGERARQRGEFGLARAQLCRALAYRPADPALLRQASAVRRRVRVNRASSYLAFGVLAAVVAAGLLVWGRSGGAEREKPALVVEPVAKPPVPAPRRQSVDPARPVKPVRPVVKAPARRAPRQHAGTGTVSASAEPQSVTPDSTRRVSIRLTGAVGGSVRIDGKERPWFGGVEHELKTGQHRFDFVPPNDTCCVETHRNVLVLPGDDVQRVTGRIPFKDAWVRVTSGRGWALSCPTLFDGALKLPGRKSVAMSQVTAKGTCTLANSAGPDATRRRVVTLRAGTTTLLPWP